MNVKDHLLTASVLLNMALGVWLVLENYQQNLWIKFASLIVSLVFFFFGVQLPDWDHEMVQKKLKFIWWLKYLCHHRGWWHTIIAVVIYGGFVAGIMALLWWFLHFQFWLYPIIFGMFGYYAHLLGDDLNTLKNKVEGKGTVALVSVRLWVKSDKKKSKKKGKK